MSGCRCERGFLPVCHEHLADMHFRSADLELEWAEECEDRGEYERGQDFRDASRNDETKAAKHLAIHVGALPWRPWWAVAREAAR